MKLIWYPPNQHRVSDYSARPPCFVPSLWSVGKTTRTKIQLPTGVAAFQCVLPIELTTFQRYCIYQAGYNGQGYDKSRQ